MKGTPVLIEPLKYPRRLLRLNDYGLDLEVAC